MSTVPKVSLNLTDTAYVVDFHQMPGGDWDAAVVIEREATHGVTEEKLVWAVGIVQLSEELYIQSKRVEPKEFGLADRIAFVQADLLIMSLDDRLGGEL